MSDEETQLIEKKRRNRSRWTLASVGGVLAIIYSITQILPPVKDGVKTGLDVWATPGDVKQIKKGMRFLADEVNGQEWRSFRIEQRLQIQDDPPKRLQFDWESANVLIRSNEPLPAALAFIKTTNTNQPDP